eukprot:403342448
MEAIEAATKRFKGRWRFIIVDKLDPCQFENQCKSKQIFDQSKLRTTNWVIGVCCNNAKKYLNFEKFKAKKKELDYYEDLIKQRQQLWEEYQNYKNNQGKGNKTQSKDFSKFMNFQFSPNFKINIWDPFRNQNEDFNSWVYLNSPQLFNYANFFKKFPKPKNIPNFDRIFVNLKTPQIEDVRHKNLAFLLSLHQALFMNDKHQQIQDFYDQNGYNLEFREKQLQYIGLTIELGIYVPLFGEYPNQIDQNKNKDNKKIDNKLNQEGSSQKWKLLETLSDAIDHQIINEETQKIEVFHRFDQDMEFNEENQETNSFFGKEDKTIRTELLQFQ